MKKLKWIIPTLFASTLAFGAVSRQLEGTSIRVGPTGGVLTLPNTTDTVVTLSASQSVTNKDISGATNNLYNIPNSATTGTSANTASTLVLRDALGDFIAGNITATLTGNASTASLATLATAATAFASDPSDCSANQFANAISINGTLTCAQVGDSALSTSYIKADGTRALTGNWNVGAFDITATTFIGALTGTASGNTTISGQTNHGVVVASSTNAMTSTGAGTSGQLLTSNGASSDPTFQTYTPTLAFWSASQLGTGGGFSTTSTSYADLSVATTDNALTSITSDTISCVKESTKLPGITCTLVNGGYYQVMASFSARNASTSSACFRLVDGSTTILNPGICQDGPGGGIDEPYTLMGFYASGGTSITFKIQGLTSNSGNASSIHQIASSPITWTVLRLK